MVLFKRAYLGNALWDKKIYARAYYSHASHLVYLKLFIIFLVLSQSQLENRAISKVTQ